MICGVKGGFLSAFLPPVIALLNAIGEWSKII